MFRHAIGKVRQAGKQIIIFIITCYQKIISPFLGQHCRFYPSCSCYAKEAITTHGVIYGGWMAIKRLIRCNPLNRGGYDPVPKKQMRNKV